MPHQLRKVLPFAFAEDFQFLVNGVHFRFGCQRRGKFPFHFQNFLDFRRGVPGLKGLNVGGLGRIRGCAELFVLVTATSFHDLKTEVHCT